MQTYWALHKDWLADLYSKFSGDDKSIEMWNKFIKDAWTNESTEVQNAVNQHRRDEYDTKIQEWEASASCPLDAKMQQR